MITNYTYSSAEHESMRYEVLAIINDEVVEEFRTDDKIKARNCQTSFREKYPEASVQVFEEEWGTNDCDFD